jgi:molecular chaperone GrpE
MSSKPDIPSDDTQREQAPGDVAEEASEREQRAESADDGSPPDIDELKAKAEESWDRYLRAAAEIENIRKRAARDVDQARKFALERFATELLAVRDSLEMGIAAGESADAESLLEGSKATLRQLASTMERFGVEEIDPQGEPFDPSRHEAMTTQPATEVEPDTVLTVYQKGYMLNGRLLRPARVVVAAAPQTKE